MKTVDPIVCDFNRIVPEIRTRFVVSPSRLIAGPNREPIVCDAVWDTGSFATVISPAVVKALSLIPMGKSPVHTANGTYLANLYSVDVMLPNGMVVQGVSVSEAELEVCDALIGMDIISMGDFLVTNIMSTNYIFARDAVRVNTRPAVADCYGRIHAELKAKSFASRAMSDLNLV